MNRFDTPLDDPVLQAGVEAWRKRIALYEAYTPIGTCRQFNKLAKRARQFPPNVEADYKSGDIYNEWSAYVEAPIARRPWRTGDRARRGTTRRRDRLIELGRDTRVRDVLLVRALASRLNAGTRVLQDFPPYRWDNPANLGSGAPGCCC